MRHYTPIFLVIFILMLWGNTPGHVFTFTTIDPPGSVATFVSITGGSVINNSGQIVGAFRDSNRRVHGYLRNRFL